MNRDESTLDCQTCGVVLRKLTHSQAQAVANNPQNYILDCGVCQRLMEKRWEQ